jgi:hypothetical protein
MKQALEGMGVGEKEGCPLRLPGGQAEETSFQQARCTASEFDGHTEEKRYIPSQRTDLGQHHLILL